VSRFAVLVLTAAVAVVAVAGVATAQTDDTAPDTGGPEPTVTLPPDASSTIPGSCPVYEPPTVVFVGELSAKSDDLAEFAVREVRSGDLEATSASVVLPDEGRFLHVGSLYQVAALADPESGELHTKVRPDRDAGKVPDTCARDPVMITHVDGTPIDTALLAGMHGEWSRVLFLILAPLVLGVGVLLALVLAKRVVRAVARVPAGR